MNPEYGSVPGVTSRYPVIRADDHGVSETTVEICTESRAVIILNDRIIGDLSLTPTDLEAFAAGYLVCEGYIGSVRDITDMRISLPEIRITVEKVADESICCRYSMNSSGGSCRELLPQGDITPLPDGPVLNASAILSSMAAVNEYSVIWRRTGGMHCSLIVREDGEIVCGVEDMGRHTTVDKAVGIALQKGTDLGECYLICSGRLPVDMVAKAYRAGIRVVISNNAAFAGGIAFARKAHMTLAGFVRPPCMTVYTGAERIFFS